MLIAMPFLVSTPVNATLVNCEPWSWPDADEEQYNEIRITGLTLCSPSQ